MKTNQTKNLSDRKLNNWSFNKYFSLKYNTVNV